MVSNGILHAKFIYDTISLILSIYTGCWVEGQGQSEFKMDRSTMFRVSSINSAIFGPL